MPDVDDFAATLAKVRRGDPYAARALVERYESVIRRVVRFHMSDARLQAAFDSIDICQSVLGSFFVRAAHGEYDIPDSEQLGRLLVGIARNKLASHARAEAAAKRDYRRGGGVAAAEAVAGDSPSPSRHAAGKELLQAVRERLTPDETVLVELRLEGVAWEEIARRVGETPVSLRKRFSRALDRVAREVGLDDHPE